MRTQPVCLMIALALSLSGLFRTASARELIVPSDFQEIHLALAIATVDSSDVIVVKENPHSPYKYEPFTMKAGIPVIADEGEEPVIDGADSASYAVEWPETASSATSLRGFIIQGGTTAGVRVRDHGVIEVCTIERTSASSGHIGLWSQGSTTIDSCTVTVAGPYTNYYGIYQTDGAPSITDCSVTISAGYAAVSVAAPTPTTGGEVSGCSITNSSGNGLYATTGSFAIRDLVVSASGNDNAGLRCGNSSGQLRSTVENCLVSTPGGVGVWVVDDSVKVQNITVDTVTLGVYSNGGVTVRNCIVTNHGGSNQAFDNVDAQYCIADGNHPYRSGSQGTGSVNEDPLYCDADNGEYTLRVDSYGNPQNNGNGLIGAFPVACMYGTLVRSTTFPGTSGVTTLAMRGDTRIPSGKTLALDDDALIKVSETDEFPITGYDASKVALIVDGGTLTATGSSGHLAILESGATSPDEGDWVGIVLEDRAYIDLSYAHVRHAVNGIKGTLTVTNDPSIKNCVFESNEAADIELGLLDLDENFWIDDNTLTVGGGSGIVVTLRDSTFVSISDNSITGDGSSTRGLSVAGRGYTGNNGTIDINGNVISGFSAGEGMKVTTTNALDSYGNTIQNSSTGVLFEKTSSSDLTSRFGLSAGSENILSGNSTGITTTGSYTKPIVRYNYIYNNTVGIQNKSGAAPNIGDSSVNGNNNITNNSTYCIWNRDGSVTVSAQGNYFGNPGGCPAPGCTSGSVNTTGWLCTNPLGLYVPMIPVSHGPLKILGVFPSPVMQSKGLGIKLYADHEREVTVGVFDIAGRLVRDLGTHRFTGGWEVSWDARDSRGVPIPSGVYFASAKADRGLSDVVKFVVVK